MRNKNVRLTYAFLPWRLGTFRLEVPDDLNFDDLLDLVCFKFKIQRFHLLEQNPVVLFVCHVV